MKKGIKIIGTTFIILGLLFVAFFFTVSYADLLTIILSLADLPETKREELTLVITFPIFKIIRTAPLFLSVGGGLLIVFSGHINSILGEFKQWLFSFFDYLNKLPRAYLLSAICIIVLSFFFNLYNVVNMPIFFDEVRTYQQFTMRSIFTSITYYPAPNNHILHSIITNITYYFPFSHTINLRLPNLIFSFLSATCFFYTFSKLLNVKISLFLLSIFCFLFPVAYYGYLSRGYALLLFAFIICFYSTIKLISSRDEDYSIKKYIVLLSVGSIVGFYTIPTFLYPYFAITSFLAFYFIKTKAVNNLLLVIASAVITILTVITLYLPVFLVSGVDAVIHNRYVEPISRLEVLHQMISHFSATSDFLFSIPLLALVIILLILSAILIYKKIKIATFSIYCFFIVPFILILHSVIPYPRIWIFLIVPFLFLIGLFIQCTNIDLRVNLKGLIISSFFCIAVLIYNFKRKIVDVEKFAFLAVATADYLIGQKANTVYCYCTRSLIGTNLKYIFSEKNEDIKVIHWLKGVPSDSLITENKFNEYIVSDKELESVDGYVFVKRIGEEIVISKSGYTLRSDK